MPESPTTTCYADQASQCRAGVVENVRVAEDTYRLRLDCPEIAREILPGQFVMLRWTDGSDPLLARPLAMYDVVSDASGNDVALDVVYLVVGRLTGMLSTCQPGQSLDIWGPLGNGFAPQPAGRSRPPRHLIVVAGGIGQTPFLSLARERLGLRQYGSPRRHAPQVERVTFCYGARNERWLACVDDFRAAGADVRLATDDGSTGHHGFVTDLLNEVLDAETDADGAHVVSCGPEPMMAAVAAITTERGVSCEVSLETPMACGVGICFSCVARVRDDHAAAGWDYRRTCVDGPVFDAARVVFER
ncbi:MAG: dihydroorotate dehydrogenase electron transfer subunit [Planctomycetales bacterium]|nr:dihydroorotate dehydrogenase electron transfer subunit [Planctomycetales bacterium]